MGERPVIEKPAIAGVDTAFINISKNTSLDDLETLSNSEGASHQDLINNKSWLKSDNRLLKPTLDDKADAVELYKIFCGEAFIPNQKCKNTSVTNSLKFLHEFIGRVLHGEGPQDLVQYIQSKPNLKQRLEKFVSEAKQMVEVEESVTQSLALAKGKDPEEVRGILQDLAKQLSERFKNQKKLWIPSFVKGSYGLEARFCYVDYSGKVTFMDTKNVFLQMLEETTIGDKIDVKLTPKINSVTNQHTEEMYSQPLIQLHSMSLERLHHPDFFRALLLPRFAHERLNEEITPNYFYTSLKTYLKAKIKRPFSPSKVPEVEKKSQRNVLGLAKGLSSMLYFTLCGSFEDGKNAAEGRALYKRLKWELQLSLFATNAKKFSTLIDLIAEVIDLEKKGKPYQHVMQKLAPLLAEIGIVTNDNPFIKIKLLGRLLEDTLQNLERAALKESKILALSAADRESLHATILEVKETLTKGRRLEKEANPNTPKDTPEANFAPNTRNEIFQSRIDMASSSAASYTAPLVGLQPSELKNFIDEPPLTDSSKIGDCLDRFYAKLLDLTPSSSSYYPLTSIQKEAQEVLIQNLLRVLPVPKTQAGEIWNAVPTDKITTILDKLDSLSKQIRKTISSKHTPEVSLALYSILAITDALVRRFPQDQTKLDPTIGISALPLLMECRSPSFQTKDGHSQEKLKEILTYFFPNFSANSLILDRVDFSTFSSNNLFSFFSAKSEAYFSITGKESDNVDSFKDPTLDLFQKILLEADPTLRQKLQTLGIKSNVSEFQQVLEFIALASKHPDLLPENLGRLFRMTLDIYSIHTLSPDSPLSLKMRVHSFTDGEKTLTLDSSHSLIKSNLIQRVIPQKLAVKEIEYNEFTSGEGTLNKLIYQINQNSLPKNKNVYSYGNLSKKLMKNHKFTREECIDLLEPLLNPYTSINGTITFIKNNLSKLTNPVAQDLLYTFIFRPLRLKTQLEDNPEIGHKLLWAIQDAIKHHAILGKDSRQTVSYLIRLGHSCEELIKSSGIHFNTPLPSIRQTIYESLLPEANTQLFRKKLFSALLHKYNARSEKEFTDENPETAELIQDIICAVNAGVSTNIKVYSSLIHHTTYDKEGEQPFLIHKFFPIIQRYFNKHQVPPFASEATALLSRIVAAFYPSTAQENLTWSFMHGSIWETQGTNGFRLDWAHGTLTRKSGESLEDLPSSVIGHTSFAKVAGAYTHCEKKSDYVWILYPSNVMVYALGNDIQFYKGGDHANPGEIFHELTELATLLPKGIYQELVRQDKDVECWFQAKKTEPYISIMLKGQELYRCPVTDNNFTFSISRKHSYRFHHIAQAENSNLVGVDWMHCSADFRDLFPEEFSDSKGKRKVAPICWKDSKTQELSSIVFNELDLSFKVKKQSGKLLAFSTDHPDFHVVPTVAVDPFPDQPKLCLRNHLNDEKLLLGRKIPEEEQKIINKTSTNRGLKEIERPYYWMEYDVKDNGELVPTDIKSALHLIELYLDLHDYEAIHKLIPHLKSIKRYTNADGDFKEGKELFKLAQKLKAVPYYLTIAMGLTLDAMWLENHLQFPKEVGAEVEELNEQELLSAYYLYRQLAGNATKYALNNAHERTILQYIHCRFQQRIAKANNQFEKLMLNVQFMHFKHAIANRWDNLHVEKPALKQRRITFENLNIKEAKKNEVEGSAFENSFCEMIKDCPDINALGAPPLNHLGNSGKHFVKDFWAYYRTASTGSKEDKEALQRQLDLYQHLESSTSTTQEEKEDPTKPKDATKTKFSPEKILQCKHIIETILKQSKKYPTLAQLSELYTAKKRAEDAKEREKDSFVDLYKLSKEKQDLRRKRLAELDDAIARADADFKNAFKKIASIESVSGFRFLIRKITLFIKVLFKILKYWWKTRNHRTYIDLKTRVQAPFRPAPVNFSQGHLDNWKQIDVTFNQYHKDFVDRNFTATEVQPDKGRDTEVLPQGDDKEPLLQRRLNDAKQDLEEHRNGLQPKTIYTLNSGADLVQERAKNKTQIDFWNTTLKSLKTLLLWQANRVPEHTNINEFFKREGVGKEISWDELKQLFLKNNVHEFKKETMLFNDQKEADQSIRDEHIKMNANGMAIYHLILSQKQKLERIDAMLGQYDALADKTSPKAHALIQLIASTSLLTRAYENNPDTFHVLAVEAGSGYMITKEQYKRKAEIVEAQRKHNCVLECIPTGEGKTTVYNRLSTYEMQYLKEFEVYKRQLTFNLWPEPLETTNTLENQHLFRQGYGKSVDRLYFDRSTEIILPSLKLLYEKLKQDLEEGVPINMRNQTTEAITLHFEMLCHAETNKPGSVPQAKEMLDYLIRIRALIRTFGVAYRDEEHKRDPYKYTAYTAGDPFPPPEKNLVFMKKTFEFLLEPDIHDLLRFKENKQATILKTDPTVLPRVKDLLIEKYMREYRVADECKASFREFALSTKGCKVPEWLKSHPMRSELVAGQGMLSMILECCLSQPAREKYTFSKKHLRDSVKPKEFAIPCDDADQPNENVNPSLIENLEELLAKTHLLYFASGMFDFQVEELIKHLKKMAEVDHASGIALPNTWAGKFFKEMIPSYPKPLYLIDANDIKALTPLLQRNNKAILYYVKQIVAPQIDLYPLCFESTCIEELDLYNKTFSLSATPLHPAAHAIKTEFRKVKGAPGQVLQLVYRDLRNKEAIRVVPQNEIPKEYALKYLTTKPEVKAAVDVGAWFKGDTNENVAEKARAAKKLHAPGDNETLSIAFFSDDEGVLCLKDIETGHVHKVGLSGSNPEERKAIYSQEKAYGSDLDNCIDALAGLLMDWQTTISKVGQSAGRMRKWATTQHVEFLFEHDVAKKIFGDQLNAELTPEKANLLILHLLRQEANENADICYRAQPLQLKNALKRRLRDKLIGVPTNDAERQSDAFRKKLLNAKGDVNRALYYWRKFQDAPGILYRKKEYDPWLLYTNNRVEDTVSHLKDLKKNYEKILKEIEGLTKKEKLEIQADFNTCAGRWEASGNTPPIPLPASVQVGNNIGMECQVLAQMQVQQQVQVQAQTPVDFKERKESPWNKDIDIFNPKKWANAAPLQSKLYRLTDFLVNILNAPFRLFLPTTNAIRNNFITVVTATTSLVIAAQISLIAFGAIAALLAATALLSVIRAQVKLTGSKCTLMRMSDVLKDHLPKRFHSIFNRLDSNFMVTNNYYNQHIQEGYDKQKPFSYELKPLREVVVIREGKNYKYIAIDGDCDRRFFTDKIKAERLDKNPPRDGVQIGIYNFDLEDFSIQGRKPHDLAHLKASEPFNKLIESAQLLKGDILFKNSQNNGFVHPVAEKVGKKVMYEFMKTHTLAMHKKNSEAFEESVTGRRLLDMPVSVFA